MPKQRVEELEELIERCAGIDVGQAEVVVRPGPRPGRQALPADRDARDDVPDLLAPRDWLGRRSA